MIATQNDAQALFRFSHYELNTAIPELRRDGRVVRMQRQPATVLSYLVLNAGRIVTREELKTHLWGGDTFVDFDSGLNFCIRQIRSALRDNATTPVFIQTIPRVGYRFIAPVIAVLELERSNGINNKIEPAATQPSAVPRFVTEVSDPRRESLGTPRLLSHRPRLAFYSFAAIALAALVVFVAVLLLRRSEQRRILGTPLTMTKATATGRALRVAISPDGQYMAYISNDGEGRSLWLKHLPTGSERQLLPSTPGMFGLLKFSNDGSYVYFTRVDTSAHGLYRIAQLGGDPQPIMKDTPFGLGISHDGTEIAVLENDPAGYSVKILRLSDQKVSTIAVLPTREYYVDSLSTISFSPDNKNVSLVLGKVRGSNSAILTIERKSGSRSEIQLPFKGEDAVLIPNRDAFLVSASIASENGGHLWLEPVGGGAPQQLLGASNYYPMLDVANDGKNAVAISLEGYISAEIWKGKSGKSELATLTDPFPQIRWLGTTRLGIVSETGKLQTLDGNSGESLNTLDDRSLRIAPCPDQKSLVLLRKVANEKPALWVFNSETSQLRRLTDGEDADPKCSADSTAAYYMHVDGANSTLWRSSLDGKTRTEIRIDGYQMQTQFDYRFDYSASPGPDPKGTWIAIRAEQNHQPKLVFISTATNRAERVLDIPQDAYDWKWKPDGTALTFINGKDPRWSLYELRFPTGKVGRLAYSNDAGIVDYDWSTDGKLAILRGYRIADVVHFSLP